MKVLAFAWLRRLVRLDRVSLMLLRAQRMIIIRNNVSSGGGKYLQSKADARPSRFLRPAVAQPVIEGLLVLVLLVVPSTAEPDLLKVNVLRTLRIIRP